jgi:hypothetical protein
VADGVFDLTRQTLGLHAQILLDCLLDGRWILAREGGKRQQH